MTRLDNNQDISEVAAEPGSLRYFKQLFRLSWPCQ
jgi:hypothetical protein